MFGRGIGLVTSKKVVGVSAAEKGVGSEMGCGRNMDGGLWRLAAAEIGGLWRSM